MLINSISDDLRLLRRPPHERVEDHENIDLLVDRRRTVKVELNRERFERVQRDGNAELVHRKRRSTGLASAEKYGAVHGLRNGDDRVCFRQKHQRHLENWLINDGEVHPAAVFNPHDVITDVAGKRLCQCLLLRNIDNTDSDELEQLGRHDARSTQVRVTKRFDLGKCHLRLNQVSNLTELR